MCYHQQHVHIFGRPLCPYRIHPFYRQHTFNMKLKQPHQFQSVQQDPHHRQQQQQQPLENHHQKPQQQSFRLRFNTIVTIILIRISI